MQLDIAGGSVEVWRVQAGHDLGLRHGAVGLGREVEGLELEGLGVEGDVFVGEMGLYW